MSESTIIAITVFSSYGVIIIGGLIFLLYGVNNITDELVNRRFRKKFKQDLYKSLSNKNPPNWDQVKIIAETNFLQKKDISRVIKQLIKEFFSEENTLTKEVVPLLEGYLNKYSQEEPFEGIPDDIRIQFDRLKKNSGIQILQLEPLTNHIRELLKINSIENKRQKIFSIISFLVGIGGLTIGVYQILTK